jgi:hypothetical protein
MIRRREFVAGLGSAAAWPVVARAQQPAMTVIGYLGTQSFDDDYNLITAPFFGGLKESGYVVAQNVTIDPGVLVSGLCFAEEKIAGHDSTSDVSVRQSNMHCHDVDAVSDGALLADRAGCRCCHLFVQCNRYFGIAE